MPEKPPLKALKAELVKNLQLDDSHHFTVFAKYHFWNSYRRSLQMCRKNQEVQIQQEDDKFLREQTIGLEPDVQDFHTKRL